MTCICGMAMTGGAIICGTAICGAIICGAVVCGAIFLGAVICGAIIRCAVICSARCLAQHCFFRSNAPCRACLGKGHQGPPPPRVGLWVGVCVVKA